MSKKDTSGPAFPTMQYEHGDDEDGMTLRDYFAAKAMQGLMGRDWSHHKGTDQDLIDTWAWSAYAMADAMLEARKK